MDHDAGIIIRSLMKSILACGLLICLPETVPALDGANTSYRASSLSHLDQKNIHRIYTEGDFEGVIAAIDSFTLSHKTHGHDDSVFIAKHLAVIYTANPLTREKGKNYMFRLLNLLPSAKIVDMFVSEEIDRIFEKVREEYVITQQSHGLDTPTLLESNQFAASKLSVKADPNPVPAAPPAPPPKKRIPPGLYWAAGGLTMVAISGTAILLMQPSKKTADKVYVLSQ
jgi:hypothetical protein